MATTYAYDTMMACGRPVGHSSKPIPFDKQNGYTWGGEYTVASGGRMGPGNHCETPIAIDAPTYIPEPYTAFRASTRIAIPKKKP